MSFLKGRRWILLSLVLLIFSPCVIAEMGVDKSESVKQSIEIKFEARLNNVPFSCGRHYSGIGTSRSTVIPSDLRFYVSALELIGSNGDHVPVILKQDGIWQYQNVVLLDFEDGSGACLNGNTPVNTIIRGEVPAGEYRGLIFTLGVPFDLNHDDPTLMPSPLNLTAMFWVWQSGHKFFKFDMATNGLSGDGSPLQKRKEKEGQRAAGFSVHLGSTGCTSASITTPPSDQCVHPNRVIVKFDRFDLRNNVVVADIAKLFLETNVDINTIGTPPGCMSGIGDADCPGIMNAFGLSYEGREAGPQQLFIVR